MKYKLLNWFRILSALKLLDQISFFVKATLSRYANAKFKKKYPDFHLPPKDLAFDAFNHVSWREYRTSGMKHAGVFSRIIQNHTRKKGLQVLEFGCGPCRIIRHMPDMLEANAPVLFGSDYNPRTIQWCKDHFNEISFELNDLLPPLPFADNSMDVVYSFSVFTHLSRDVQEKWSDEIHRILKPGGLVILTTHGERYRHLLTTEKEKEMYKKGRIIIQDNYSEGKKWFLSIHPKQYITGRLLANFEDVIKVATHPDDTLYQDVWTGKKGLVQKSILNIDNIL